MTSLRAEPGSFRDRESRVFEYHGRIFRALSPTALADWEALAKTRVFATLTESGRLPRTERVTFDERELRDLSPRFVGVLEHEALPFVSYPYEWSFSMLRAAALLTLDVLDAALEEGMKLKHASAYNVQFRGSQPQFIDLGSFESWRPGEPWVGYRQFCQHFLYPLLLEAYKGVPFQPWLRGALDGIEPAAMAGVMSARDLMRAGVLTHVVLQAKLARHSSTSSVRRDLAASGFSKEMIVNNVGAVRRLIERLRPRRERSQWSDYAETHSYDSSDAAAKRALVSRAVTASDAKTVWDLGSNTGEFSLLAAQSADRVIAMDGDEVAIDRFYQRLAAGRASKILPLVVHLHDPSPGLGWRNRERRDLASRGRPDLTLALALAHHLVISNNIPLADLFEWLQSLGGHLVIEFVSKQDPMVQKLLLDKIDNYDDWDEAVFERQLMARFEVIERVGLGSGTRFLYFARSRPSSPGGGASTTTT